MTTTQTQISNIFNLLAQNPTSGLRFYHFGWRFDINRNIDNNFDPDNLTGRLYPALQMDVPESAIYLDAIDELPAREQLSIVLYFDNLQDYENDSTQKVENLIEQWSNLKSIADKFLYNFRLLFEDTYQAGYIQPNSVKFVQRSNMHNDRLVTWEVSFLLVHQIECITQGDIINTDDFPPTLEETDLERTAWTPKTACERIIGQLTKDLKLYCVLPTYDFCDTDTRNALSTQQKGCLKPVIVPTLDYTIGFDDDFNLFNPTQIADLTTRLGGGGGQQYSMLFDGLNEGINCYNIAACNFTNLQPFTITSWVKSANYGGAIQGIVTKRSGAAGGTGWTFFFLNGDLYCLLQNGINYINMRTQGVTFTNNTFYHLALTVSGSGTAAGVKFYANGLQLPTFTIQDNLNASIVNTAAVMVGNEEALSMPFNGKIGYSRIFNIEFSPAQVVTDYSGNGGKMWETSPEIANQVFGWKSGQGALFGSPLANYYFFPNELDDMQPAPFSNNMEITDKTTDVPV